MHDDCPEPTEPDERGWIDEETMEFADVATELRGMLERPIPRQPHPGRFAARVAPVLRNGIAYGDGPEEPAVVVVAGEVVALVMPLRAEGMSEGGVVDGRGR